MLSWQAIGNRKQRNPAQSTITPLSRSPGALGLFNTNVNTVDRFLIFKDVFRTFWKKFRITREYTQASVLSKIIRHIVHIVCIV